MTRTETDDAIIADVRVVEPNGDEHRFEVFVTPDETNVTGEDDILDYLHQRYGSVLFSSVIRSAVLREQLGPESSKEN